MFGFCVAALGAILFSAKAVLIKLAYAYPVTPATLLALRMICAMPFYLIIASLAGRNAAALKARDLLEVLSFGLIGYYGASMFDFAGLAYISAGLERLLLYSYPAVVLLLSALVFSRPVTRKEVLALVITYAGVAFVVVNDIGEAGAAAEWLFGVLLVLISALAYAIYLIGSQRVIARLGASRYTALAMLAATGGTLLHFSLAGSFSELAGLPAAIYGYGVALGIFGTVLPTLMTSAGIARIGAARTAMIGALGPVATLLLAWALLGETVTAVQIGGTILILSGINMASDREQVDPKRERGLSATCAR